MTLVRQADGRGGRRLLGAISISSFIVGDLINRKLDWADARRIFFLSLRCFERLAVLVLGYSDKYRIDPV